MEKLSSFRQQLESRKENFETEDCSINVKKPITSKHRLSKILEAFQIQMLKTR